MTETEMQPTTENTGTDSTENLTENQSAEATTATAGETVETTETAEAAETTETVETAETAETEATAAPEAEPAEPEEISYHAVEKEGSVTALWEMQGRKHLRTIDPRSSEGKHILSLFTSDHHEEAA